MHETVIYELHVKGMTARHPEVPPEQRGTYAGLAHPAVIEHLRDLGVTSVELQPVHQFVHDAHLVDRGLRNYWGYNSIGFFAPHNEYAAAGGGGGQVPEFKTMVKRAPRGRDRGDPRRRLQPHGRGQPPGPHAVVQGARQRGVLPPRGRRPELLHGLHGHREHAQHAAPARAAARDGLAALLGHRDARRRVPLRPGLGPRPGAARSRPSLGLLRPDPAGSRRQPGEADRRAVGRRRGGLPGRQLPAAAGRSGTASTATRSATTGAARVPPLAELASRITGSS